MIKLEREIEIERERGLVVGDSSWIVEENGYMFSFVSERVIEFSENESEKERERDIERLREGEREGRKRKSEGKEREKTTRAICFCL